MGWGGGQVAIISTIRAAEPLDNTATVCVCVCL